MDWDYQREAFPIILISDQSQFVENSNHHSFISKWNKILKMYFEENPSKYRKYTFLLLLVMRLCMYSFLFSPSQEYIHNKFKETGGHTFQIP